MPNGSTAKLTIEHLRHCVYADLICYLPPASREQAVNFMTNLSLPAEAIQKFLLLRVSPDIAKLGRFDPPFVLHRLGEKYGGDIDRIAGFYRNGRGELCWNVPSGCALYPYRSRLGFFNGILCQPLYRIDSYFLLSSAAYGGAKAIRLTDSDKALFDAGLLTYSPHHPAIAAQRREARI